MCSDVVERNVEFNKITETLAANGYPRKLVNKEISRQLKRSETCAINDDERVLVTVSIPFIDGLSQEIRRIARTAGVRCAFTAPNTLKVLYAVKDKLLEECTTHAIYSIRCKTCDGEYVGETLRQVGARKKSMWMRSGWVKTRNWQSQSTCIVSCRRMKLIGHQQR